MAAADRLAGIAERALAWACVRGYAGHSKHDGLNSPWLKRLSLGRKWPRILAIQGVMRSPIDLRGALGVRPARNAKGVALFARAWLDHHKITGLETSAREARRLLDWLLEHPAASGFPGLCWGYPYPWQDLGFFAPAGSPNRIVTYFVGRALVHGFEALGDARYLEGAREACRFILEAPRVLYEDAEQKCLSYVPRDDITMAVMDVSPLCGSLCAKVGVAASLPELVDEGRRLVAWAVARQTAYGAWYYTDPPGDSPITHDNYHTGEIVDSLREFREATGDDRFEGAYRAGLAHYRRDLFTEAWRPKWMHDTVYPHDVHGYAVGILTFTAAGELDVAGEIAAAAIEDLWDDPQGRFHYQRRRRYTTRITLMRWCQAWMCHALLALVQAQRSRAQR